MTCRICYEPDNLTSVCKCDGSVKWVHIQCIQKWIDVSQRRNCELCHEPFEHRLLRAPPIFRIYYVETVSLGFFLGSTYAIFLWINALLAIKWLTILNFVLFNMVLVFLSLALVRVRKLLWPMIFAYLGAYTILNVIMNIIHYFPAVVPFYLGDAFIILALLTTDVFAVYFRNNRV